MDAFSSAHRSHVVPTHVHTPETLLTLAGMSLTVRQFLLILAGIALSYRVWLGLSGLSLLPAGQIVRWVLTAIPLLVALAFAFVSLAARPLDVWCVAILRYSLRPHRLVWRSIRLTDPGLGGASEEEEEADGESRHDDATAT